MGRLFLRGNLAEQDLQSDLDDLYRHAFGLLWRYLERNCVRSETSNILLLVRHQEIPCVTARSVSPACKRRRMENPGITIQEKGRLARTCP